MPAQLATNFSAAFQFNCITDAGYHQSTGCGDPVASPVSVPSPSASPTVLTGVAGGSSSSLSRTSIILIAVLVPVGVCLCVVCLLCVRECIAMRREEEEAKVSDGVAHFSAAV